MSEAAHQRQAEFFAALGDTKRMRLVELLAQQGRASTATLAAAFEISRQGVTKHLRALEYAGIVHSEKRGREVVYGMHSEEFADAAAWLTDIANHWDRRLAGIKAAAEK